MFQCFRDWGCETLKHETLGTEVQHLHEHSIIAVIGL